MDSYFVATRVQMLHNRKSQPAGLATLLNDAVCRHLQRAHLGRCERLVAGGGASRVERWRGANRRTAKECREERKRIEVLPRNIGVLVDLA